MIRHGPGHKYNPSEVNYRANLLALKDVGVTHILAATACGSLQEKFAPGSFVILDSFIDRTTKRSQTFHTQERTGARFGTVCHIPMHPAFCPKTSAVMYQASLALAMDRVYPKGTVVTIEGPRFSSRAESLLFKSWGVDVINMTTVPEVVLAKELGLSYAAVAMVTDYDCWRAGEECVDVQKVLETMKNNVDRARKLIVKSVQMLAQEEWTETVKSNQVSRFWMPGFSRHS